MEHEFAPELVAALAHAHNVEQLAASNSEIVSALIMPRSATTQTRLIENCLRNRSTAGIRLLTSAGFPDHISVHPPAVAVEQHHRN